MSSETPVRKLYRSDTNKVIGGVCGGLGEYFEVDPVIVRVLFVLLAIPGGGGVLVYLVLFFLMPSRAALGTPAEDLRDLGARAKVAAEELRVEAKRFAEDIRAARAARHKRRHEFGMLVGLLLVCIGALALFDVIFPFEWFSWHRLWPILLIVLGVFLVARRLNDEQKVITDKTDKKEEHGQEN